MPTPYRIPVEETFSWQRPVINMTEVTAPAIPLKGDRYIIAGVGGAWSTYTIGDIAWCSNATGPVWSKDTPLEGWEIYDKDTQQTYIWKSGVWVSDATHPRQHAIDSTSDHTSSISTGKVIIADANGLPAEGSNSDTDISTAYDSRGIWDNDLGNIIMTL